MTKLLELDVIEGINYPEIPENYDGEICPYYFNRECEDLLLMVSNNDKGRYINRMCLRYCPTNFEKCLAHTFISTIESIPWDDFQAELYKYLKEKTKT